MSIWLSVCYVNCNYFIVSPVTTLANVSQDYVKHGKPSTATKNGRDVDYLGCGLDWSLIFGETEAPPQGTDTTSSSDTLTIFADKRELVLEMKWEKRKDAGHGLQSDQATAHSK